MDRATTKGERLSYARCFVEVSVAKMLPSSISLKVEDGEELEVEVEYEWVPPSCSVCTSFGHSIEQCPTKQKWQLKEVAGMKGRTTQAYVVGGTQGSSTSFANVDRNLEATRESRLEAKGWFCRIQRPLSWFI